MINLMLISMLGGDTSTSAPTRHIFLAAMLLFVWFDQFPDADVLQELFSCDLQALPA